MPLMQITVPPHEQHALRIIVNPKEIDSDSVAELLIVFAKAAVVAGLESAVIKDESDGAIVAVAW